MTCTCSRSDRLWCGAPGRCERCGGRTDWLTDDEMSELESVLGPCLRLTALIAEVRERRAAESARR